MPELPEVETVTNAIRPILENNKFSNIDIINPKLRIPIPNDLATKLVGQKITNISRRAKYITISFENNLTMIMHLGMSGKILTHKDKPELQKHDHLLVKFASGDYLTFNDTRKFGLVTYLEENKLATSKFFAHLGIEPLNPDFNGKYLKEISKNSNIAIKKFIMEQKNIVGVGNIYACEALFLSKINPLKPAKTLTLTQSELLSQNIISTLKKAIKQGGSTIKDYKHSDGSAGYFQHEFTTYGRANKACKSCDNLIERIVQAGRSTFYCPKCQKL